MNGGHGRHHTSALEWAVAILGGALVIALLGYLVMEAVRRPDTPPDVLARVERVRVVRGGYLVQIRVANRGERTAQGLTVTGELRRDGAAPATSAATFDYVPARSERAGGLFFQEDPRAGQLELHVGGYQEP